MIPLRDTNPSRRFPIMTVLLILFSVGVYFYQVELSVRGYQELINQYALIPLRFIRAEMWLQGCWSLLSHLFLHANFWHLLGNMWALWLFGDNIEDHMGAFRFLLFYLTMGIIAGIVHVYLNQGSDVPTLGASGAIAGVMGAYIIMYPFSKILTLIPLFGLVPLFFEIPALIYLGIWFLIQISAVVYGVGDVSNIAWGAHAGGFMAGLFLHRLYFPMRTSRSSRRYY